MLMIKPERKKMNLEELEALKSEALGAVKAAADAASLEAARVKYLGRSGSVTAVMKSLKDVAPADRPAFGKAANALRQAVEAAISERQAELASGEASSGPAFDHTMPGRWPESGSLHPLSMVVKEVARIFSRIGFTVADGPDIETRFNNFTALNTAPHHPSMD